MARETELVMICACVVAGVVDRTLERACVDHEGEDHLRQAHDRQHQKLRIAEDAEYLGPRRSQQKEDEVDDPDAAHKQSFLGVVDAGLRHTEQLRHGCDRGEKIHDLHPRQGIGSDREDNRSDIADRKLDHHVNEEHEGEQRHEAEEPAEPMVVRLAHHRSSRESIGHLLFLHRCLSIQAAKLKVE